ncbi:MAG: nucleotidyltransferase family protein [Acidobacteriaceae bacterium]|nr:nucleotidyltransferase family protein [Acidobacteriaceae bacterium]
MSGQAGCSPVAAVILAAGAATRMGTLKQVMSFGEKTLAEHAVMEAREAGFDPVIVVVGAQSKSVRSKLAAQPVAMVENRQWQSGMGSSISVGIQYLLGLGIDSAAVAILLADQPLIKASHLKAMRDQFSHTGATIIAARYNEVLGVPAIFKRSLFAALTVLDPAAGARSLLRDPAQQTVSFDLPEAAVDIDTPEDFAALSRDAGLK